MTAALAPPRVPAPVFASAGYFLPRLLFLSTEIAPQIHWGDITRTLRDFPGDAVDLASAAFWETWRERWAASGAEYETVAAASTTVAGRRSARRSAAACYHWAEFMYFDDVATKRGLREDARRCFEASLLGARVLWEPGVVTVDGFAVRYWVVRPPEPRPDGRPFPTVVISNGLDSVTEVEPLSLGEAFLARGMAVVLFEGPGQGTSIGEVPLRLDMEVVVEAVTRAIEDHPALDATRRAFVGISFGGYTALRVARTLPDFACVVNYSGGPTVSPYERLPRRLKQDFRYALGLPDDEAAAVTLRGLALDPDVPPVTRVLSVHGALDDIFPVADVERFTETWPGRAELVVCPDEAHVCLNRLSEATLRMSDWVDQCL